MTLYVQFGGLYSGFFIGYLGAEAAYHRMLYF